MESGSGPTAHVITAGKMGLWTELKFQTEYVPIVFNLLLFGRSSWLFSRVGYRLFQTQSHCPRKCAYQESTGRRCQINSTVWIFPFTGAAGVINMIRSPWNLTLRTRSLST